MPSTPAHWWIAGKLILHCYFIFCSQLPILSFFQQRGGKWGRLWSLFPQFLSLCAFSYVVLLGLLTLQKSGGRRAQFWESLCCTAASVPKTRAPTWTWSLSHCPVLLAPLESADSDGLWLVFPPPGRTLNRKAGGHFSPSSSSWSFQSQKLSLQLGRKQVPLTSPGWCMEIFQRCYLAGRSCQTDLATCFSLPMFQNQALWLAEATVMTCCVFCELLCLISWMRKANAARTILS